MAHYLRTPSVERLPGLLEELYTGALRIPPFQRDFEWTGEQRIALCDSILRGLPTGALMVWRTDRKLAVENPIGPYWLPPSQVVAPQYLLDGRQRMTTLYAALAAALWTREGDEPEPRERDAPDGTPWAILYDLDTQEFVLDWPNRDAEDSALPLFANDQKPALLPLAVILDDLAYDDWRVKARLSRELANRARAARSAFTDYLIPVLPLVTDDISVVTLTFKRVNSGGTPMGDADMTRALVWSQDFDLRTQIDAVRERLKPRGWEMLPDDALLKVVAAVSRVDPTGVDPKHLDPTEVDLEKLAHRIKADPSRIQAAGDCVAVATDLLRRLGIAGPDALPYTQILVFVARAVGDAGGSLNPEQQKRVTGWAAEACLDDRFRAGQPHMIRAYWRAFARRAGLPDAEPAMRDEHQRKVKECWRFSMAWARSRGTALALANEGPRGGDEQPFEDPAALVARGTDNIGMLVAEGGEGLPAPVLRQVRAKLLATALRSPANRILCPPEKLPGLRQALFQKACPTEVLNSHLVTPDAHEALLGGDLAAFFEARRTAIIEAEKRWVEAHGGHVEIARESGTYAKG